MNNTYWSECYDNLASYNLKYSSKTYSEEVLSACDRYKDLTAYSFYGKKTKYSKFKEEIINASKALLSLGVKKDDVVTVCLPNIPQGIILFYAINKIGAIASMIHPLSSKNEIEYFIKDSASKFAITLDAFAPKFNNILKNNQNFNKLIITSVIDKLKPLKKIGYYFFTGRKIKKIIINSQMIKYKKFIKDFGEVTIKDFPEAKSCDEGAAILYSGGSTGLNKGILLSNLNFNALAKQIIAVNPDFKPGDKFLSIMPIFHGFGLGIGIHSMLANGGHCILVPRFNPTIYSKTIIKQKPNYIAGVPSIFQAMISNKKLQKSDLSFLKGVFSGGDSLSPELKTRIDDFLKITNKKIICREGYGLTECVTASCLTPTSIQKDKSIGLPLPDMIYKIVEPGTTKELKENQNGEICISGPTVMKGYINSEKENAKTLMKHKDGNIYIHSGDLGYMDEDGFVYFVQRIKRLIISNGYNIFPSQIENVLDTNDYVQASCVVGVKDPMKMQKVKAYVILKENYKPSDQVKKDIMNYLKDRISKYALPYDIEFKTEFPKTLVGKIDFKVIEKEANNIK